MQKEIKKEVNSRDFAKRNYYIEIIVRIRKRKEIVKSFKEIKIYFGN